MLEEVIQRAWPEWKVEERIGKGGFGTVFKVDKVGGISMPSAVKVIPVPGDESEIDSLEAEGYSEEQTSKYFKEYLSGLEKEIELMAKFKSSNNIVKIEDYKIVDKEDGFGWYVLVRMELLTPLTAFVKQGALSEEEVIKLGIDICSALELCEKEGIIHRDIKPANIFVDQNGNYKLGDFGIARELGSRSVKTVAGTEQYIAPEVMVGKYDSRADIYSLGLVLYSLLNNNNLPFLNDNIKTNPGKRAEAIKRRLEGNEVFPTPMNASEEMTDLLAWTCSYDKNGKWKSEEKDVPYTEKRIESASRLKKELTDILSGSYILRGDRTIRIPHGPKEPDSVPEPKKKTSNKKIKMLIGLIVLLFLVGGGIVLGAMLLNREDEDAGNDLDNKGAESSITITPEATDMPTPTLTAIATEVPAPTSTTVPVTVTIEPTVSFVPTASAATPEPEVHEHVYTEEMVQEANCGSEGEVKYYCEECKDTYTEVLPIAGEHSYENDMDESCEVCGAIRKVGHDYVSKVTKKATCGEAGVKTYTCSDCGDSYTEAISATGKHSYKNACDESCDVCGKTRNVEHEWKLATCTKPKTCTVCGITQGTAEGHTWKAVTCTNPKTCTTCGITQGIAEGHTWKVATCTSPKTCITCGTTQGIAEGHTWKAATCTNPKTCTTCGTTQGTAEGHTWKAATCTNPKTCIICGTTQGIAGGHTWKVATCTSPKTCTTCGITEGSASGHTFSSNTDITCNVCNEVCGYWSEYGAWSAWQDTAVTSSESRQVETQEVVVGYNKKTQWKYSRYYGYTGSYYLALDYSSGICTTYEETDWLDYPLEYKSYTNKKGVISWGYGMNVLDNKYIHWYNEQTREVDDLNSPIYKTQYRYKERRVIYY